MNFLEAFDKLGVLNEEKVEKTSAVATGMLTKAKSFVGDYVRSGYWYHSNSKDIANINTAQDLLQIAFMFHIL